MNKILVILSFVLVTSCGPSQQEKKRVAAVTCSIMAETREIDAALRVREMNEARDKIGGRPFLRGDNAIQEAIVQGMCRELVLDTYDGDARAEKQRRAAEKQSRAAEKQRIAAEKQRIADSNPSVKQDYHLNRKLMYRISYQPKIDGGKRHGLSEIYHENGYLARKYNYKDGKQDGLSEIYYENGELHSTSCYNNGEAADMSYCEK